MRGSVRGKADEHINIILKETHETDPRVAIRLKARELLRQYRLYLPDQPPYNMEELASLASLQLSDEHPVYSDDSELIPQVDGRVALRVNKNRPFTRQRFSIAHELGHTLFPDYHLSVRCRKANERRWDEDDVLEILCDIAASEFMFPLPWFQESLDRLDWTAEGILKLADHYQASPEATVRRIVEITVGPVAAVFFSWKHKPSEAAQIRRNRLQAALCAELKPIDPERMLRVDYPVLNDAFRKEVMSHIPAHKSIRNEGPIYQASMTQLPCEGDGQLSLKSNDLDFHVIAIPIFTESKDQGPSNGSSAVAILRPNF